jgi:hypothetical protein
MKDLKELGLYFDNSDKGNKVYSREYVEGELNFVAFNVETGTYISGVEDVTHNIFTETHHDSYESMLKSVGG